MLFLTLQRTHPGDPKKYAAKVVAVGHECDLALLTTDAPEFWEGTTALELGYAIVCYCHAHMITSLAMLWSSHMTTT